MACHLSTTSFMGLRLICHPAPQIIPINQSKNPMNLTIKVVALEARKEKPMSKRSRIVPHAYTLDEGMRPTKQWPPPNQADDPKIHNPLLRLECMGCGWFDVILEWEGVIVEDNRELEQQAWLSLAEEEGKPPPSTLVLRRTEGMKNEQAISEVLCWSRDPSELRRMAARKEEIHKNLRNSTRYAEAGEEEEKRRKGILVINYLEWQNYKLMKFGVAFLQFQISGWHFYNLKVLEWHNQFSLF